MARWAEIEMHIPELAARANALLDAHIHKMLATLRRDGSPRISGIEVHRADGDLWIGCMWQSLKALDLRRDPRFVLHGGSIDPPEWQADAKMGGRAEEILDEERVRAMNGAVEPGTSHLFRLDVSELVVVALGDPPDHLLIDSWHEGRGLTRRKRM
jgi:hypothetical protein